MLDTNFSIVDYLVFVSLLIASSLIGVYFWYKSRKTATNAEYLIGNRQLSLVPVIMSMAATFMSTNTLLGMPAEVYQVGTQVWLTAVSCIIAVVLTAEVFVPIYYSMGFISVNEYLGKRFDADYMRLADPLFGDCIVWAGSGTQCSDTAINTYGGIKAVIWTDVLQGSLMILGVLVVIVTGIIEMGGLKELWDINERGGRLKFFNMKVDIYNHDNFWNVLIGTTVNWSGAYCISQQQIQRYCNVGSPQKGRRALYWNLPGLIVFIVMSITCGMVIYAKYHACDPVTLGLIKRHDQLMPYYVMDTLSQYPGLPGLFVACAFSGALSTLSSGYNSLAAITWEDLIKDRVKLKNESQALLVSKLIAMSYGLIIIGFAFLVGKAGTVMQAAMAISGAMGGPIFALYLVGIFYPYATAPGALIGFLSGYGVNSVLAIGSLVMPRPKVSLPTTLDHCPVEVIQSVFTRFETLPNSTYIPSYDNVEGLGQFFHISYLLLSTIGFTICIVVSVLASLCIGKQIKTLDTKLMSPIVKYQKSNEIETIDATNISVPNDTPNIYQPNITHKVTSGALIGFLCGYGVSTVLAIGSLVMPRPKVSLPTTLDNCPVDVIQSVFTRFETLPNSTYIPSYDNVEGLGQFFHISYLLLSTIGFTICIVVSVLTSLCIGKQIKTLDTKMMSPIIKYIFPGSCAQHKQKSNEIETIDATYVSEPNDTPNISQPHITHEVTSVI
ncbi:unnamed protein product [Oppiella nova]|uniref:Sodium-coupled monocarboxylate transporter 1 n=1 Tax=Oppiella nova TaxID=334625 RepID=A0A7R9LMW1_9ACAR|nr:unnamed protein product [Oppiella nova]CAG2165233.1 unnamed protein product [Oppiella nova]